MKLEQNKERNQDEVMIVMNWKRMFVWYAHCSVNLLIAAVICQCTISDKKDKIYIFCAIVKSATDIHLYFKQIINQKYFSQLVLANENLVDVVRRCFQTIVPLIAAIVCLVTSPESQNVFVRGLLLAKYLAIICCSVMYSISVRTFDIILRISSAVE